MKRICKYCGKKYEGKTSSKYCDLECRTQHYRVKRQIKLQTDNEFRKNFKNYQKSKEYQKQRRKWAKKTGYMKNYMKQWREKNYEHWIRYKREYSSKNRERNREQCREYRQTENGKMASKRHKAKRRELGNTLLFGEKLIFPKETKPELAHINPRISAILPSITHNLISGVYAEEHTKNTKKWIEKIYCCDLDKLLNP